MENRTLEITLQYAKDLNNVNLFTKMDVYAVVSISGGGDKQKTKSPVDNDGDANPTWNFPMKFTLDEAALQNDRLTIDFKLICERALGDKDVGEVNVPIKELLDSPANGAAAAKRIASYQVRKPSGKPKGQITFSYNFGETSIVAAAAPPYGAPVSYAPPSGKADGEPVTAYPAGSSSGYPPMGAYPPPALYTAAEGGSSYPPAPAGYPQSGGVYPPPKEGYGEIGGVYPPAPAGYPHSGGALPHGVYAPPPAPGYGYPPPPQPGYGYPPPPQPGYGYPPPPQPGYGYPPHGGYGYAQPPPAAGQKPAKKNKFGMGLGAGLLGGALGGLLIGDMVSDGGDFDCDF